VTGTAAQFSPTLWQLFFRFAVIGLTGFGGVLPSARHQLVDRHKWVTDAEFTEQYSLAQFFPGPNIANFCVIYGRRHHGLPGATVALLGLYLFPTILTIAAGFAINRWWSIPQVQHTFGAIMPVASGLMLGAAAKLLKGMQISWWTIAITATTFVLMVVAGMSLWLVLLVTAPAAVALSLLEARRKSGRGS
jgi:chromate transporter